MFSVCFRDEIGVVCVAVNEWGISFLDGCAYFTAADTEKEYRIKTEYLIEIIAGSIKNF